MKEEYQVEKVEWLDSCVQHGWCEVGDDLKPEVVTTVGWVVGESEGHVVLAGSIDLHQQARHKTSIIKGNIVKREKMRGAGSKGK